MKKNVKKGTTRLLPTINFKHSNRIVTRNQFISTSCSLSHSPISSPTEGNAIAISISCEPHVSIYHQHQAYVGQLGVSLSHFAATTTLVSSFVHNTEHNLNQSINAMQKPQIRTWKGCDVWL